MDERRKNQRVDVAFPVECTLPAKKNYFYTVAKDLSSHGAKIITEDFLAKGHVIKVNLNMIDKMIYLKAKVAWCNKERTSHERYAAGVEFMEINQADGNELSHFLNKVYNS